MADKSLIDDRYKELNFYRTLLVGLGKGDLIFDIGANRGTKTSIFLSLEARVVAVEPDEANQAILTAMFLRYRLTPKTVIIVPEAVSDQSTVETMWIDEPGSAKNSFSRKWVETLKTDAKRFGVSAEFAHQRQIQTTTLEALTVKYGPPFFVKIDVEGYELNVLRGMKRPVPYLSFEVNLPEFRAEGLQCIDLLRHLAPDGTFNYSVDCRDGVLLQEWLDASAFSLVLNQCSHESIEVFWRSTISPRT